MNARPLTITSFEACMLTSLAIGFATLFYSFDAYCRDAYSGWTLVLNLLVLVGFLVLVLQISRKRNGYARWIFLGVFAVAIVLAARQIGDYFSGTFLSSVNLLQLVLQVVAVGLLLTTPGTWFARQITAQQRAIAAATSKGASVAAAATAAWWRDPRYRSIIFQFVALAFVIFVGWYLVNNTTSNMEKRGIASGCSFLGTTAGFGIIQSLIPYAETSTYGRVLMVGLFNTILLAFVGVIFATALGFVMGVARLSSNYLVRKLATIYIETFRNIPLLLQILFWYVAVLKPLPGPRESLSIFEAFFLNNRGLYLPVLDSSWAFIALILVAIVGVVIATIISRWAKARQERTGQQFPTFLVGLALVLGAPFVTFLIASYSVGFDVPKLEGFNFTGGLVIIPELIAMLIALSVYTASFIAEIVRAGIQSVSHGQSEAAHALGVRPRPTLRLVIIPQALRVIIPPLTSQYLNLTKNSSLAVAIAYPDLTAVFAGTVLNQTGQAVEIIAITMAVYLTISLLTSGYMNWYNARKALVER